MHENVNSWKQREGHTWDGVASVASHHTSAALCLCVKCFTFSTACSVFCAVLCLRAQCSAAGSDGNNMRLLNVETHSVALGVFLRCFFPFAYFYPREHIPVSAEAAGQDPTQ